MTVTEGSRPDVWAVVPAAGVGRRMRSHQPKQYLTVGERTVLEHALYQLLAVEQIRKLILVVGENDEYCDRIELLADHRIECITGGSERVFSVLNGLRALSRWAGESDWVLVHDAVRPCVRPDDILRMMTAVSDHAVGGVLGVPVVDTIKRVDNSGHIIETVCRNGLWHAQTPQVFRFGVLLKAIESAVADRYLITDEASALEYMGFAPKMVEGHSDNIKVTARADLDRVSFCLMGGNGKAGGR